MEIKKLTLLVSCIIFVYGCSTIQQATTYDYPKPVDTTSRPVLMQEKKTYEVSETGVLADNLFDGARLSDFIYEGDNIYKASILPENEPINPSPWYAFRLSSKQPQTINLHLVYKNAEHRYDPKINVGDGVWTPIDATLIQYDADSMGVTFPVRLNANKITVAAQEVINSTDVKDWCLKQAQHRDVTFTEVGISKLERPMFHLNIQRGVSKDKETIVVISRQHPPEVTGYMAMEAFIEELLSDTPLANDFRGKYRIMVFPLMNPDGVDLGHWRHNAGGIDMNRDWAYYHQPENRVIANYVVENTAKNDNKVILGMDFHSTYYDIYYTRTDPSTLTGFKDYWLDGIKSSIDGYDPHDAPSDGVSRPTSSAWFFTQFGAESLTYEIADTTSRNFIMQKGQVSAQEMMQLLIYR